MYVGKLFFVFPWTDNFYRLHSCPYVKDGIFRIGRRIHSTLFYSRYLIVAKQTLFL
jgi:hypothetical protein